MKLEHDSRQVPKNVQVCANKKYYDIMYSYFQCISEKPEYKGGPRPFPKSEVNFTKLGQRFNLTRQTCSTKFKNLMELGLIREKDKDNYELIVLDKDVAALIPFDTLKLLTDTLSEHSISAYIYFLMKYCGNKNKPFQFTLDEVKRHIGISTTTRSNNDTITNILYVLQKLGLIEYSLTTKLQEADNFQNIKTIYQIEGVQNKIELS